MGRVSTSILVVDDDVGILKYISKILADPARRLTTCNSGGEVLERLQGEYSHNLALLGSNLAGVKPADLVTRMHETDPRIAIVLMPYSDEYCDLPAMIRSGVRGFLPKPFVPQQLLEVVQEFASITDSLKRPEAVELKISEQTYLVYASPCMRGIQEQAALVARFNLPVLILGESGTGQGGYRTLHPLLVSAGDQHIPEGELRSSTLRVA
jgi:two-component system response regulator HydG